MYYVGFSSATIVASLILFQGFNTTDSTNTISLLAGFIVTFLGVHLLNISRQPDHLPQHVHPSTLDTGLMHPRLSLQGRPSLDGWAGPPPPRARSGASPTRGRQSGGQLFGSAFERQQEGGEPDGEAVSLHLLREEGDEDDEDADERTRLHSPQKDRLAHTPRAGSWSRSNSHSPSQAPHYPT